MYSIDLDLMQPGDIIFSSEKSVTSKVIRTFTGGDYSHVLLCVAYGCCIHADKKGGVHSFNAQRLLARSPSQLIVKRYTAGFSPEQLKEIDLYVRLKIGTQYSMWEAVKAAPFLNKKWIGHLEIDLNKPSGLQFCSRLIAEAYSRAGINLVDNPFSCAPSGIFESYLLGPVEGAVIQLQEDKIELAQDESKNKISIHNNIIKDLLAEAREIYGDAIQTLADLGEASITIEGADDIIVDIMNRSGYLEFWQDEIKTNPWRYNQEYFESAATNHHERSRIAKRELAMAQDELKRHSESQEIAWINYCNFPNKTFGQRVELYETLTSLAELKINLFSRY